MSERDPPAEFDRTRTRTERRDAGIERREAQRERDRARAELRSDAADDLDLEEDYIDVRREDDQFVAGPTEEGESVLVDRAEQELREDVASEFGVDEDDVIVEEDGDGLTAELTEEAEEAVLEERRQEAERQLKQDAADSHPDFGTSDFRVRERDGELTVRPRLRSVREQVADEYEGFDADDFRAQYDNIEGEFDVRMRDDARREFELEQVHESVREEHPDAGRYGTYYEEDGVYRVEVGSGDDAITDYVATDDASESVAAELRQEAIADQFADDLEFDVDLGADDVVQQEDTFTLSDEAEQRVADQQRRNVASQFDDQFDVDVTTDDVQLEGDEFVLNPELYIDQAVRDDEELTREDIADFDIEGDEVQLEFTEDFQREQAVDQFVAEEDISRDDIDNVEFDGEMLDIEFSEDYQRDRVRQQAADELGISPTDIDDLRREDDGFVPVIEDEDARERVMFNQMEEEFDVDLDREYMDPPEDDTFGPDRSTVEMEPLQFESEGTQYATGLEALQSEVMQLGREESDLGDLGRSAGTVFDATVEQYQRELDTGPIRTVGSTIREPPSTSDITSGAHDLTTDAISREREGISQTVSGYRSDASNIQATIQEAESPRDLSPSLDIQNEQVALGVGIAAIPEPTPVTETVGLGIAGGALALEGIRRREGFGQAEVDVPDSREPVNPGEVRAPESRQPSIGTEIDAPASRQPAIGREVDAPASRRPVMRREVDAPASRQPVAPDEIAVDSAAPAIIDQPSPTGPTIEQPDQPTIEQPTRPEIADDHSPFVFPGTGTGSGTSETVREEVDRLEDAQRHGTQIDTGVGPEVGPGVGFGPASRTGPQQGTGPGTAAGTLPGVRAGLQTGTAQPPAIASETAPDMGLSEPQVQENVMSEPFAHQFQSFQTRARRRRRSISVPWPDLEAESPDDTGQPPGWASDDFFNPFAGPDEILGFSASETEREGPAPMEGLRSDENPLRRDP